MPKGFQPKKKGTHFNSRVTTKLTESDYKDFEALVKDNDVTIAEYLRSLIDERLKTYRHAKSKQMKIE